MDRYPIQSPLFGYEKVAQGNNTRKQRNGASGARGSNKAKVSKILLTNSGKLDRRCSAAKNGLVTVNKDGSFDKRRKWYRDMKKGSNSPKRGRKKR